MNKVLIFGNSGSGKSTYAKYLSHKHNLAHLDLDVLAWEPTNPPQRKSIADSKVEIDNFINENPNWVIEGCYTDLLNLLKLKADSIIFLNLSAEDCIENAKNRPWEPHKYESKEAQDSNLEMLIKWIKDYYDRNDVFSHEQHCEFFERYDGEKFEYKTNENFTI